MANFEWSEIVSQILSRQNIVQNNTTDVPNWLTTRVLKGGFVSGKYEAGGALLLHELEYITRFKISDPSRLGLNSFFLSRAGQELLGQRLKDGLYRIEIAEECVLLIITIQRLLGHIEKARSLLYLISPWLSKLRFYPRFIDDQVTMELDQVCVSRYSVGHVRQQLVRLQQRQKPQLYRFEHSIQTVIPLIDTLINLYSETFDDPDYPATYVHGVIVGSWPLQRFPPGWFNRLQKCIETLQKCTINKKDSNKTFLEIGIKLLHDPTTVTSRQVGKLRCYLAHIYHKRHFPNSIKTKLQREHQLKCLKPNTKKCTTIIAGILLDRISHFSDHETIINTDDYLGKIRGTETIKAHLLHIEIPKKLKRIIMLAHSAPLETLLLLNQIPSAEIFSSLIPQLACRTYVSNEPQVQTVYQRCYTAFRKRKSLLLQSNQDALQFHELPWIKVVEPLIQKDECSCIKVLNQICKLTIMHFPSTVIPNKLVKEVHTLFSNASINVPLTEELAADIFTGRFTKKYTDAALEAIEYFQDTIYQKYYHLPILEKIKNKNISQMIGYTYPELENGTNYVIQNGIVIERSMVLTSHNLVPFIQVACIEANEMESLVMKSLKQVQQLISKASNTCLLYKNRLTAIKNAAYAWRHAITYFAALEIEGENIGGLLDYYINFFQDDTMKYLLCELQKAYSSKEHFKIFWGWSQDTHFLM